jgi:hypothetical protein
MVRGFQTYFLKLSKIFKYLRLNINVFKKRI